MAEYQVTLDLGDGFTGDLKSAINHLRKEIDKVYKSGSSNNDTVRNQQLTNLQQAITSATTQIRDQVNQAKNGLDNARLTNDSIAYSKIADLLKELVDSEVELDSLYNSNHFAKLSNFSVTSSTPFASPTHQRLNDNWSSNLKYFGDEVQNLANRISTNASHWNKTVQSGVTTYEKYNDYQNNTSVLDKQLSHTRQVYSDISSSYDETLSYYIDKRAELNDLISSGNATTEDVAERSALDEAILGLEKSKSKMVQLETTLENARTTLMASQEAITNQTSIKYGRYRADYINDSNFTVLSPKNSISGILRDHKQQIIRSSVIASATSMAVGVSRGNNQILHSYDNIKSTMYSSNLSDKQIREALMRNPYGYNLESSAGYLNAYTSSRSDVNLNAKQVQRLTSRWESLALNSGALDNTTNQLLMVAGLTVTGGLSVDNASRLADTIQNTIQNSGMNAKADEQLQALASMYQIANQTGNVTTTNLKDIAGFQAMMSAQGSMWQGQAGAQAYQGLANTSNISTGNTENLNLWQSNSDFTGYTSGSNSAIQAMQRAQKARRDPYYYKTPIANLYRHNQGDIERTSQNLVEMSNGGLSFKQAKALVNLYANGKFTRQNIRSYEKGNGKGNESAYNKSGTKSVRDMQKATQDTEVRAAQSLTFFYRGLSKLANHLPFLIFGQSFASNVYSNLAGNVLGSYIQSGKLGENLKGIKFNRESLSRLPKGRTALIGGSLLMAGMLIHHENKQNEENEDNKISSSTLDKVKNTKVKGLDDKDINRANSNLGDNTNQDTPTKVKHDHTFREIRIKGDKLLVKTNSGEELTLGQYLLSPSAMYGLAPTEIHLKRLEAEEKKNKQASRAQDQKNEVDHKYVQHQQRALRKHLNWWVNEIYKKAKNYHGKGSDSGSADGSAAGGDWGLPIAGMTKANITSPFGPRGGSWHDGIDISFGAGQTHDITAMHGGKVIKIDHQGMTQNDLGYYIIIKSDDGYEEIYQEFAFTPEQAQRAIKVKVGDTVKTGDVIGKLIEDGSSITHIHVGVTKGKSVEESLPHSFDSSWSAWQDPASLIFGHALGGLFSPPRKHANGGTFDSITSYVQNATPKNRDTLAEFDIYTVKRQSLIKTQPIQPKHTFRRNAPQISVNIDTSEALAYNKDSLIDEVINTEFSSWLDHNYNENLLEYYAN